MPAGKVEDIRLTPDGQAELTLSIDDEVRAAAPGHARHRPPGLALRRRQPLHRPPPPGRTTQPRSPTAARSSRSSTTTAVDLDEIFNTLDEPTRKDLQQADQGPRTPSTQGRGEQMNAGLLYLNPSLSASSRLFRELNADSKLLERFVVSSSQLVTDLADRREDVSGLVDNLATTTNAIGSEQAGAGRLRRAAAGLHAPRQHDLPEPARDARRPRAAGGRLQAGRQEAAARSSPSCARWRVTRGRPSRTSASCSSSPGSGNDLIDLTNAPGPAARHRGRRRQRERQGPPGRVPGLDRGARERRRRRSGTSGPTRSTCSAGSTTSATPAPTTRSAPPRASASTPAPSRCSRASSRRSRRSCATRPSRPPRRPTSATAARAAATTSPRTARGPGSRRRTSTATRARRSRAS